MRSGLEGNASRKEGVAPSDKTSFSAETAPAERSHGFKHHRAGRVPGAGHGSFGQTYCRVKRTEDGGRSH